MTDSSGRNRIRRRRIRSLLRRIPPEAPEFDRWLDRYAQASGPYQDWKSAPSALRFGLVAALLPSGFVKGSLQLWKTEYKTSPAAAITLLLVLCAGPIIILVDSGTRPLGWYAGGNNAADRITGICFLASLFPCGAWYALLRRKSSRGRALLLTMPVFLFCALSFDLAFRLANAKWDKSTGKPVAAVFREFEKMGVRGRGYRVRIVLHSDIDREIWIRGSHPDTYKFRALAPGAPLSCIVRDGALGMPYLASIDVASNPDKMNGDDEPLRSGSPK